MVEQACALAYAGVDVLPVLRRNDEREKIERPGPLRAVGVGVDVVGDAVVANLPLQVGGAAVEVVKTVAAEKVEKRGPAFGKRFGRCFCLLALRGPGRRKSLFRAGEEQAGALGLGLALAGLLRGGDEQGRGDGAATQFVEMACRCGRRQGRSQLSRGFQRMGCKKGLVVVFHVAQKVANVQQISTQYGKQDPPVLREF